ncbi:permease [Allosalinactinospora lopnorensis]|uniref:permease n=1 Tax=Allosalinactinospora lopnorensis TaxID=1352348 RepID=UPI000623BEE1|nr:permease [Allosalinactinospora lopnorensis]
MTALLGQFAALFAAMLVLFAALTVLVTLLTRRIGESRLRGWLGGNAAVAPLKGLVVGALTPFCSWSTVPVLLSLLRARVRLSAVAAFYLASPVLDPVLIVVLVVLFGMPAAVAFTVFVGAATLAGAVLAERFRLDRLLLERARVPAGAGGRADDDRTGDPPWRGWSREGRGALDVALGHVRVLLIPLAVASAIGVAIAGAVPRELVIDLAGPDRVFAVPVAALLGVPLYLPTEALAPLGWALRDAGVGVGAIFALVITAAGLSLPEFGLLAGIVRARLIAGLIALVTVIAVAGGLLIPNLAVLLGA